MNRECTHDQYYSQFVGKAMREYVVQMIGPHRLRLSTDPHLNDIPLSSWDIVGKSITSYVDIEHWRQCATADLNASGGGNWNELNPGRATFSLAETVCLAKAAAREWLSEQRNMNESC